MKKPLIILALTLLAGFAVIASRRDEPVVPSGSETPWFVVRVAVPRLGLPFAGILPDALVTRFDLTPRELGFDHASPGAEIGSVGPDRLQFRAAEGWDLSIEADGEGRIAPGTHLVVPLGIGGSRMKLRCRRADRGGGYLRITTPPGAASLAGRFRVDFAPCEDAETGQPIEWPPRPLSVSGSFAGLAF